MSNGAFRYHGRIYPYFTGHYQSTRINERAVEVSVALGHYNRAFRVLEVGAVLPHYIPNWPDEWHEVIDLHETFPAVINADVLTYEPTMLSPLVICISTLDHLNDANEVCTAVRRMKSWLAPDGLLFATVPALQPAEIGGGAWLDELVLSGALEMDVTRMDKVEPLAHGWREVLLNGLEPLEYNGQTHFANTVYLMEWRNG